MEYVTTIKIGESHEKIIESSTKSRGLRNVSNKSDLNDPMLTQDVTIGLGQCNGCCMTMWG